MLFAHGGGAMADEIAQVCELEIQGIKMVCKGTLEVISFMARAIKAMFSGGQSLVDWAHTKFLNRKGNKTFKEMLDLCDGNPPQALSIREADFEEVLRLAEQRGLHYHMAVDFIPNDGMVPVLISPQEVPLWGQIYKAVASRRLEEDKKTVFSYDKSIAEEKEKLNNCKDPEERAGIEARMENYEQAKREASQWVDYAEEVINKEDVTMSLQDYLKQSKGTDFEKNPEAAMAEHKMGVEIGPKISAKESFQPIRDKSFMPDSKIMFYVPETGAIVTREFKLDEGTGLVYSDYSVKTDNGEIFSCSDKGKTKAAWNEDGLPALLDKAGLLEGIACRAFDNEEKLKRFLSYHNKLASPSQEKVEAALKEGKEVFSQAEAKDEVIKSVSEQSKGIASAEATGAEVEIVCHPQMLTRENGKIRLQLSEDESILFSNMHNEGMGPNGMLKFTIDDSSNATFVKGGRHATAGSAISPNEVQGKLMEALGEGIAKAMSKDPHRKQ